MPMLHAGRRLATCMFRGDRVPVVAAVMFAAVVVARIVDPRPADAVLVLLVVPIAMCAVAYGQRGGLGAAAVAVVICVAWAQHDDADIGLAGFASRATAFVVVGAMVGRYAAQRRVLTRQLERFHDVAVDLHALASLDGRFTRVNPAGCRLLGYTEEELLQRPFLELVHPDDRERTIRQAQQVAAGDDNIGFENRYRRKDGTFVWLHWTSGSDVASGVIYASARDITAQRSASETLERLVAERTADVEAARIENLRRLALAAEYRDDETHQHTQRVGALSAVLAARVGLPDEFAANLLHAAPLHDIGKLGVTDTILLKPGRLTEQERGLMQEHTTIGAAILDGSRFPVLQLGEEIALSHHERWDGSGYPQGLAGEAIPIAGRIVAVADVFDALTHARPYKPAWSVADAAAEIIRGAGSQFDPVVVAAFAELHREDGLDAVMRHEQLAKLTPPLRLAS
jgi:PAS domain S-box-containing protein